MANNNGQVQIDVIAKDFNSVVDALISFAVAEFGPGTASNRIWTDFNVSSFSRTWLELVAYVSDLIFFYLDNQATEAYLESATLRSSVLKIARQFGYKVPTAASAGGTVTFTVSGSTTIPAGFRLQSTSGVAFFTTQAASSGIAGTFDVAVLQGTKVLDQFTAAGVQNEEVILSSLEVVVDDTNALTNLRSPIVTINGDTWTKVDTFIDSFPTSKHYLITLQDDGKSVIRFGDGLLGRKLSTGDSILVDYRTGGGTSGNISKNTLTTALDKADNFVSINNAEDFGGGADAPTIDQLRDLIPASLRTLNRAVTEQDYSDLILLNFPQISKASSSIEGTDTGIDLNIYLIPIGDTVTQITSNPNLLASIGSFLRLRKMVTAQFKIKDGFNLAVQIGVRAFLNQNANRSVIEANIQSALNAFLNFRSGTISDNKTGPNFGQTIRLSDIYEVLSTVEGISRFEITQLTYKPRVAPRNVNINKPNFSDIQALEEAKRLEYYIVLETTAPNVSGSSVEQYDVYQREQFTVTNLSDNTITDIEADFSILTSTGSISGAIIRDTNGRVFVKDEFKVGYLLIDSNNSIFEIVENSTSTITINVTPINPDGSSFVDGSYSIIRDLRDISAGGSKRSRLVFNSQIISIQYNNKNTLFTVVGSQLLNLGTLGDIFLVSTKLTDPLVRSNIVDNTLFPLIQLDDTLINSCYMRFPTSEYSAYDPISGVISIQDIVDLSSIVAGDIFVDFNGDEFPILGDIVDTPGSKSFRIKSGILKVDEFDPTSYNIVNGFVSVPDSVDLSNVKVDDVFIDANGILYRILGGISDLAGSKGFNIESGIGTVDVSIGATIYQGISQQNALSIEGPFDPTAYVSITGIVTVPDSVDLSDIVVGDIFVDASESVFTITGGIDNTNGAKKFTIATGQSVNVGNGALLFRGAQTPKVVGFGDINDIRPGDILIDNAGTVGLIESVNPKVNRVTLISNSRKPLSGICELTPKTQISIPLLNTSISNTAVSGVFQIGDTLLNEKSKIVPGDLLIDRNGLSNEILEVPYISFINSSPTAYTYSVNANTIVFHNATPTAFTYNSVTGVIQYGTSVDLSAVASGDLFRDGAAVDFTIVLVDYANSAVKIATGQTVNNTAGNDAGGSIRTGASSGYIHYSSAVDLSNVLPNDLFKDSNAEEYVIETASDAMDVVRITTAPVSIGLSSGANFGGSIRSYDRVKLTSDFTTPQVGTKATITRRYFSPENEATWKVSWDGNPAKAGFLDIDELGNEPATENKADSFTIRTSPFLDDITNARQEEVPTLDSSDIDLDLRGGN